MNQNTTNDTVKNYGLLIRASNPHPHGQIWAQQTIPVEPNKETSNYRKYFDNHKKTMLYDYISLALKDKERVVIENGNFLVLVPFWAIWTFETIIISRDSYENITGFNNSTIQDFAESLRVISQKYDKIFNISFPYSAGIHQAPTDGNPHPEWHFHMNLYPPLLRSETIKKHMVGYEMLCNPQRDITAEYAAEILKKL